MTVALFEHAKRSILLAVYLAEVVCCLLIVKHWSYVTTYRLYLDHRVGRADHSAAAQKFDIEGNRVLPQIVTRGPDRISFKTSIGQDSIVRVDVRPLASSSYAIHWLDGRTERTLASGTARTAATIACPFPTGNGIVEFISDGPVTWVDPRIVRQLKVQGHVALLVGLVACSVGWRRRTGRAKADATSSVRTTFKRATTLASLVLSLLGVETALRAMGDAVPSGIAAERHDLGEVIRDPQWEESPRYGRRLRRRINTVNEWRYGDIVRMGFIPAAVANGVVHRFRFVTDEEGFRNPTTRDRFEIAALGDSFTDALTLNVEASWPMQLEQQLGLAVQNYGTAGFGPQQELLVLKDFIASHRPSRVVLAFFAGNDLFDAEAFDKFERSGGQVQRAASGWRIKDVVTRADTWFVISALRAGSYWFHRQYGPRVVEAAEPSPVPPAAVPSGAFFDRGMFTASVHGHTLRWAFMPPYLNTLNFSERELQERQGWRLTRNAILEMQRVTRAFGGDFIVMFLPFKAQVYWPLLEREFSRERVESALRFYLEGNGRGVDVDGMRRNRLAQNRLMRQLCEEANISFVDTTAALQARVEAGEDVYFADESHLNAIGQPLSRMCSVRGSRAITGWG